MSCVFSFNGDLCGFSSLCFPTEECVLSLWFAVVPSYSSLPKGENCSPKSKNRIKSTHQTCQFSEWTQSGACCSSLGVAIWQHPLWMPSTRVQQSLVSDPTALSSAPHLCNGNEQVISGSFTNMENMCCFPSASFSCLSNIRAENEVLLCHDNST